MLLIFIINKILLRTTISILINFNIDENMTKLIINRMYWSWIFLNSILSKIKFHNEKYYFLFSIDISVHNMTPYSHLYQSLYQNIGLLFISSQIFVFNFTKFKNIQFNIKHNKMNFINFLLIRLLLWINL